MCVGHSYFPYLEQVSVFSQLVENTMSSQKSVIGQYFFNRTDMYKQMHQNVNRQNYFFLCQVTPASAQSPTFGNSPCYSVTAHRLQDISFG